MRLAGYVWRPASSAAMEIALEVLLPWSGAFCMGSSGLKIR